MPALIETALESRRSSLSKNTWDQYQVVGRKLSEIFADATYEQITPKDIVRLRMALADTPNMANRCLTVLRIVFNYALEMQLIERNPAVGVDRLKEPERERLLTHDEIARIKTNAAPRLAILIDLMYLTGQRVNDVLRIRYADLTDEGIQFKQQKTGKRLLVTWSPELRAVVKRAHALCGNVRALTLLHGRTGKAPDYSTTKLQWSEACAKAGVEDAQLRDIRAMSLTNAEEQGFNPTHLAGHSSEAMTKRYLRSKKTKVVQGPSFVRQPSKKGTLSH